MYSCGESGKETRDLHHSVKVEIDCERCDGKGYVVTDNLSVLKTNIAIELAMTLSLFILLALLFSLALLSKSVGYVLFAILPATLAYKKAVDTKVAWGVYKILRDFGEKEPDFSHLQENLEREQDEEEVIDEYLESLLN